MVRKRSVRMRRRSKNSRSKTPAPKTGWVIAELAQITGLPVRLSGHQTVIHAAVSW